LIKVELLVGFTSLCTDDNIVSHECQESGTSSLRLNVEGSLDIEAEVLIVLSLSWFWLIFIDIDDIPLLIDPVSSSIDDDVGILLIDSSGNFNDFAS
jgi:hypothetical protein